MRADNGSIDHVGVGVSLDHLGQCFEHGIENAYFDPSSIAAEYAVPLAVFVGQVAPLRTRPDHPHHVLEKTPVVMARPAAAPTFRRQKRPDQCPFLIRQTDTLAQDFL